MYTKKCARVTFFFFGCKVIVITKNEDLTLNVFETCVGVNWLSYKTLDKFMRVTLVHDNDV